MIDWFIISACLIITGLAVFLCGLAFFIYEEAKYIAKLSEKNYKHRKRK